MKRVLKIISIAFLVTSSDGDHEGARAQSPPLPSPSVGPPGAPPTLTLQQVSPTSPEASPAPSPSPDERTRRFLDFGGNEALMRLPNPYTQEVPRSYAVPDSGATGGGAVAAPDPRYQELIRTGGGAAVARLPNPFTMVSASDANPIPAPQMLPNPYQAVSPSNQMGPAYPPPGAGMPGAPAAGMPGAPGGGAPGAPGAGPEAGGAGAGAAPGAGAGAGAAADAFGAAAGAATGPGLGGGFGGGQGVFTMIGDQGSTGFHSAAAGPVGPPILPGSQGGALLFPSVRSFKIAENQSPRPMDRFFFDFNYYNDLNAAINRRDNVPLASLKAYRYLFGLEKTFNKGKGSVGLRFPINTLTADTTIKTIAAPTETTTGDLSVFAKYILEQDVQTGSLVSVGMLITTPTGPKNFAGAPYIRSIHTIDFQPFIGYIWNYNRFYLHGFSSFDFPANYNDVTMIYNDVGVGYYVLRSPDPSRLLTAIAPTFEVHVNNPINHRDVFNKLDIAGTPDVVNLTYGVNFEFHKRSLLTFALVTPVTSPKPFDTEALLLFNYRFGMSRNNPVVNPPLISN